MARYAVIQGGTVVNVIVANAVLPGVDMVPSETANIGWIRSGTGAAAVLVPPPATGPPPPPVRAISPLAFRRRLPVAARQQLTQAAAQDARVRVMLDDLASAREVNLDDPALRADLDALVAFGLLTAQQRSALLADGQPEER